MQLPIGLFGVAIGTVTLPLISRHAARGDADAMRTSIRQALELVALLCLPAAAGLAWFGVPVVGLIYEHGRFTAADTAASAQALAGYAVGLAGYAGIKVLAPAFFALNDATTPMRVSLLSVVVNFALNWLFVRVLGFGALGLALSTSAVALANFGILLVVLRHRLGPLGGGMTATLVRIVVATALMVLAALAVDVTLAGWTPAHLAPVLRHGLRVAVVLPAAVAAFWVACRLLGLSVPSFRRRPRAQS